MYGRTLPDGDEQVQVVPKEVAGELEGETAVMLTAGGARTTVVTHNGVSGTLQPAGCGIKVKKADAGTGGGGRRLSGSRWC